MAVEIEDLREKHLAEIDQQMDEFRPAHEAFLRLQEYKDSLSGGKTTTRRSSNGGSRGTRAGVDRRQEVIDFLRENPGATIPDMGKGMNVSNNYLYRVRDGLVDEGIIRKEGNKHFLADGGTPTDAPAKGAKGKEPAAA